jgi:hypothetical protein
MQNDEEINQVSQGTAETAASPPLSGGTSSAYKLRVLVAGFSILAVSMLVGIWLSFHTWDLGSPFDYSIWESYNPVGRATYGPLLFALVLFPITIPLLLVLSVPIYFGMRRAKLWPLSLLGFISMGLRWVWYITLLWEMD